MRRLAALLFCLTLFCAPLPALASTEDLAQTNRLLQAEYELAKSQKLYFIFDLQAAQILFRVSGVTLAKLPILSLHSWGRPADGIAYALARRSARKEPVRQQIVIPDGKEPEKPATPAPPVKPGEIKAPELQALEIADMPTQYELELDEGTLLTIRAPLAENADYQEKYRYYLDKYSWYVTRSLSSLREHRQGGSHNETLITLPEREARMLYWSFQVGERCLVRWP